MWSPPSWRFVIRSFPKEVWIVVVVVVVCPSSVVRSRGLVDLLIARRRVRGVHLKGRTPVVDLEVVGVRSELNQAGLVLGVAGVRGTLDADALVGVVARVGDYKRLVDVPAIRVLIRVEVEFVEIEVAVEVA